MSRTLILLSVFAVFAAFQADKPAYNIFSNFGKQVDYQSMIDTIKQADIVFFGELHDNPIAHWLEYEITADLYHYKQQDLVIGAEMFEADNQEGVDNYLEGKTDEKQLAEEVRLWPNYKTDYKPLLDFAKEYHLRFIATNVPRSFASLVFKGGFESLDNLSKEEKAWIAPLPIKYEPNLACYKEMMSMAMGMHSGNQGNENLPKAQAVKDATMAFFILQNYSEGKLFIHYNGSYHSDNFEGIVWYIKQNNPKLKIKTISTVLQKEAVKLEGENWHKADYIIAIPETMTRTY